MQYCLLLSYFGTFYKIKVEGNFDIFCTQAFKLKIHMHVFMLNKIVKISQTQKFRNLKKEILIIKIELKGI